MCSKVGETFALFLFHISSSLQKVVLHGKDNTNTEMLKEKQYTVTPIHTVYFPNIKNLSFMNLSSLKFYVWLCGSLVNVTYISKP